MLRTLIALACAAAAGSAYIGWSFLGRSGPRGSVSPRIDEHAILGAGDHKGAAHHRTVLAVQPAVEAADFASADRLHEKLDAYLKDAASHGELGPKTIVLFPEHIGTWLLAAHEKRRVYEAPDLLSAASVICASNLPLFAREYVRAAAQDKASWALFAFKAEVIARSYEAVFSTLAKDHRCTIVAGSVVLPDPVVTDGRLLPGDGPLMNASFTFGSHGRILGPPAPRCFPDPGEQAFTVAGDTRDLPIYATPAGRVGVLVGRDAFQPAAHDALRQQGIDLLLVPAFLDGHEAWTRPFAGTPGSELPPDIAAGDVGRITEAEAWLTHGPAARLSQCGAQAQVTAFLKGHLWERPVDGAVLASAAGETWPGPLVEGGSWVSVHLPPLPDSRAA